MPCLQAMQRPPVRAAVAASIVAPHSEQVTWAADDMLRVGGLTIKLTDRRALTFGKPKTPRHQSQAQTAVRRSALVRRRDSHYQPTSGGSVCRPGGASRK